MKFISRKKFKYNGEIIEAGDEFIPKDGKWDAQILDPANKFITIVHEKEHICSDCGRAFASPQGLAAHSRFCKGGNK